MLTANQNLATYGKNVKSGSLKKYDPQNPGFDDKINPEYIKTIIPVFKDYQFSINTDEEGNGGF